MSHLQKRASAACFTLGLLLAGCACPPAPLSDRPFQFGKDTFSYPNELVWEYRLDAETGQMRHKRREPPAQYSHRCFVMARSVLQFYNSATFAPELPLTSSRDLRRRIHKVISSNPRHSRLGSDRIVIPGFTNLSELSLCRGDLLKKECGGPLTSYFQRGHWRIIWPFSRAHQARTAEELAGQARRGRPAVVHLIRFPELKINHAAVVFACRETQSQIQFQIYDPNDPETPALLTYERAERAFTLPLNMYFSGGPLDVYQVYHHWNY